MNKFSKLIITTAVASLAIATPVLANQSLPLSSTQAGQLETIVDMHAVKTMSDAAYSMSTQVDPAAAARHIGLVSSQVQKLDQEAAKNHIFYLQKRIENAKENVRIKQEIVNNYTNLAKVNPQFADKIAAAQTDLANALNDQAKEEAALAAAVELFAKYN